MLYLLPSDTCFWLACSINDLEWYNKIYMLKWRDFYKPLAIMVDSYDFLEKNTNITKTQINFLKNYHRPFSVLLEYKIQNENNNLINTINSLPNKELYKKISLRIANIEEQKKLINEIWPIFLTSANISWKNEVYSWKEVYDIFWKYIKKWEVKALFKKNLILPEIKPSDIFEFIWVSLEINYLRKL